MRVRLEDCLGGLLGNLPPDSDGEEEYEHGTNEEEQEWNGSVSIAELWGRNAEGCRKKANGNSSQFLLNPPTF